MKHVKCEKRVNSATELRFFEVNVEQIFPVPYFKKKQNNFLHYSVQVMGIMKTKNFGTLCEETMRNFVQRYISMKEW